MLGKSHPAFDEGYFMKFHTEKKEKLNVWTFLEEKKF